MDSYETCSFGQTQLSYLDSTPVPPSQPSRLVVAIHGVGYNAKTFLPVFKHLSSHFRMITYNQRSYEGSSEGVPNEQVLRTNLDDLSHFLHHLIDRKILTTEGGLTLLGWSKGTIPLIGLLGSPASEWAFLEPYLRSIVLFEPPGSAWNRPATPDLKAFLEGDASRSMAERFETFICGYDPADANLPPSDPETIKRLAPGAWQPECVPQGFAWGLKHGNIDAKDALTKPEGFLEKVAVGVLVGQCTVEYCKDAARTAQACFDERSKTMAKALVREIEGANHFAFILQPTRFVDRLDGLLKELEA